MKKSFTILFSFALISLFSSCKSTNNEALAPCAIDEKIYVPINGTTHYMLLRGDDISNPLILFIHGGPGIPNTSVLYNLIEGLKHDFTFVTYDQRGVGRTYYETKKTNPENNIITKELLLSDVDSIVDYLRARFNKDKIIIMGHSYGSLIGITYVNSHPDKVLHYIGSAQSVKREDVLHVTYEKAYKLIKDNPKKQKKLEEEYNYCINHKEDSKKGFRLQGKIDKILEKNMDGLIKPNVVKLALTSPDFEAKDLRYFLSFINIKKLFERNKESMEWLGDANLFLENTIFTVPLSFISGEYDETCPLELIYEYMDVIEAPYKNFVLIDNVGHSPQLATPKELSKAIKDELKYLKE